MPNHFRLSQSSFGRYGISPQTVHEFEISYGSMGGSSDCLIIPLHDSSGLRIGHAALSDSGSRLIMPVSLAAEQVLYNCHRAVASGSRHVIVVPDFLDCMRVSQCGFRAVVALLGSGMSETQEIELIAHFGSVALMFRGDDEGWALTQDCVRRLVTQVSVHAAVLPSNQAPRDLSDRDLLEALGHSGIKD